MKTVTVSSKYQISIPSSVRRQLGIKPGDRLVCDVRGDHLVLFVEPRNGEEWARKWLGSGKEVWQGIDAVEYVRRERGVCEE